MFLSFFSLFPLNVGSLFANHVVRRKNNHAVTMRNNCNFEALIMKCANAVLFAIATVHASDAG